MDKDIQKMLNELYAYRIAVDPAKPGGDMAAAVLYTAKEDGTIEVKGISFDELYPPQRDDLMDAFRYSLASGLLKNLPKPTWRTHLRDLRERIALWIAPWLA